ncbi:MAG TPA: YajQ family cyclic di-GMP-binding protein [Fimbriimonadaceae bacterium]|nr:YajQ family cyclic di-GMP-binding protein [Fimbriimonadaceae bacterium]
MAPKDFSFDIVSRVNQQEVRNAIDQAQKELMNRYDFKGSKAEIQFEKDEVTLIADDEFKMEQLKDIVVSKLLKRGVDMRQIDYGKQEAGTGLTIRQKMNFKAGIPQDQAKSITKQIRDKGLKVSASIQGDELRVIGKDKDELQKTINFVKGLDLPFPVDFVNFR